MTYQGDPYRTLGLVPGASVNEIRSAYRLLAMRDDLFHHGRTLIEILTEQHEVERAT